MERLTRGKAIRAYCLGCCCEQPSEVRKCPKKDCPLYPYRLGYEEHEDIKELTEEEQV